MARRFATRLLALETQMSGPDVLAGVGLASLLASVALHPPQPWALPDLSELATPPTGLARCLWEARRRQDTSR